MKNQNLKTTLAGVLLAIILFGNYACSGDKKIKEAANSAPFEMTLHAAALTGNTEIIQEHIKAKSDLNEKDEYGSTALSISATFGKTEIAKQLIDAGADLNTKTADGSNALHVAAFFGRTEIVKMLLEGGVDHHARNNFGATALETTSTPFNNLKMIYDQVAKDLGPMGLQLDYEELQSARPVIARMIAEHKNSH